MENYLDKVFNSKKCIEKTQKYREYKLTFGEFIYIFTKYEILYPKFQKDLNVDKINEMISSYKRNPNFFYFKNKIVLSYISHTNNIYIIDGQHRIELIKYLVDNNYNSFIYLCCYIIDDENDQNELFDELNKDSYKNYTYIYLDDFSKQLHHKFSDYLNTYYSLYFEKKQKKESYRKTITEFLEDIEKQNYLLQFNNFDNLKQDFENSNFNFNYLINYQDIYNNNQKVFYKDEHDCVKNGIIFTLSNNNFIDYLINNDIKPHHKFKKEKKRITINLKKKVWEEEFGDINSATCPYKKCTNIITKKDYSCGHIISEYNGGSTTIDNLKPMCYGCNNKLGKRNWIL